MLTAFEAFEVLFPKLHKWEQAKLIQGRVSGTEHFRQYGEDWNIPLIAVPVKGTQKKWVFGDAAVDTVKAINLFLKTMEERHPTQVVLVKMIVSEARKTYSNLATLHTKNLPEDQEKLFVRKEYAGLVYMAGILLEDAKEARHVGKYSQTATVLGWDEE